MVDGGGEVSAVAMRMIIKNQRPRKSLVRVGVESWYGGRGVLWMSR